MTPKGTTKKETRLALLEAGAELMFLKGYSNTGIAEVLKSVNVPKGSFYYYFDSKEHFAVEIINEFDRMYREEVLTVLKDKSMTPVERLRAYCNESRRKFLDAECKEGCIIGNLSQEMSGQSEALRERLFQVMSAWSNEFALCIEEGQNAGEIPKRFSPGHLAEMFMCGWQGAVMRAKTTKDSRPLDIFLELMFDGLLNSS